jgi:glycine dehydrogenase
MKTNTFIYRHLGPRAAEVSQMFQTIGVSDMEQLIYETIPDNIRLQKPLRLPSPLTEQEFMQHIETLAEKNKIFRSFIGLGYYNTTMPGVIQRNILENPSWYTSYTPYQAEISQGRLEALLNYQTMLTELTGMELANASLLDEATAAAEAMGMFFNLRDRKQKKAGVNKFFVGVNVLPQTIAVLETRAHTLGIEIVKGIFSQIEFDDTFFGALVQYPMKHGKVVDFSGFVRKAHQSGVKVAVAADLMALVLLTPPGQWDADAVIGTTQRFGLPLAYGGPHAGYFATRADYKRYIPGRIIGVSVDAQGKRALRMALQTREQHIKRDKATSNICTAQVLLAVLSGMYAVYHGPEGLKEIARHIHNQAKKLNKGLKDLGYNQLHDVFFDTLLVQADSKKIKKQAEALKMNFNYFLGDDKIGISIDENTTDEDIKNILAVFADKQSLPDLSDAYEVIPQKLLRKDDFMRQEVFNSYQSETEMMRYIKRLERKDISLTHSMIPLGSCTMKLNASTEMFPISWNSWNNIHPFVPENQVDGYKEVIANLEKYLAEITGLDAVSLQPNSGAAGEYAGLLAIRKFHESKGEGQRNIALIPASAHGTNPASAVMAGHKVVVVKTTDEGNIDVDDLREKAEKYKDNLSVFMVTYPSTHGVFESAIKEMTDIVHLNGGQVYMDGANMNAQVGLTNPGIIGADVCHLNLHKTFAIPHGGGGPGVGPIAVKKHLADFLPSHPLVTTGGRNGSAVAAAPYGSVLVSLISYAYIRLAGANGLKKATEYAILNANYLEALLKDYYPVLYTGERGRAAHEFIADCRPFKEKGITVGDIAKRLMDYGYHAPTVSFPVHDTLMIEPTESESKAELDRFAEAMIAIWHEIQAVDENNNDNPLKNAPHTEEVVTADVWFHGYSRKQAAFPLDYIRENKFWPAVSRVDDAYGDRNLHCTCDPVEAYMEE